MLLSTKGVGALHPLATLLGIAYLGTAILAVVLTPLIKAAGQSLLEGLRKVREPSILGFATWSACVMPGCSINTALATRA
ncbi:hypothetical protein WK62_05790 [Burkholderia ubonensis]|nr:hypothetical protein WK62_05790 [Burkholderia ubonensis]